ncbi:ABC transporter permease [Pedosphaera parvula]|uniref:Permease n=1 Tax=Pedosphaera parvula (strain Ellin514) TaxID=320771 RepID=B9XIL9_PEDPL|nr:ABC transporter permease [Pedosphaera parvula]EEF60282.1 permease [Pedosphaera parvula Ellin514]
MKAIRTIWSRLRAFGRRRTLKQEIDEELQFHLAQRVEENIAAGMSAEEAARAARRRFGNVQSVREECRALRGVSLGETVLQDVRFGARMLRKNRGFTAVVVLTLALGIGANSAIFSFVNAILLRPLPCQDPERLVSICHVYPELNLYGAPASPSGYLHYREHAISFANMGAAEGWSPILTGHDQPERLSGMKVTASFFPTLGVKAIKGRLFLAEEDKPGANRVAVISYDFWKRDFQGDPDVLGKRLTLDGIGYAILGVLPSGFKLRGDTDVWTVPGVTDPSSRDESLLVLGRLKPGVTLTQARTEMNALADAFRQEVFGGIRTARIELTGLREMIVGEIRPALVTLSGVVAMVLLIACLNVANLLLARAAARQKEIAVRSALGAGRLRLVRQMLTESLLLSLLGGGGGLLLAFFALGIMRAAVPVEVAQYIQGWQHVEIDLRVVGFTLAVSLVTGTIFGLAPAWQGTWVNVNETLKESGRGASDGRQRQRLRSLLIVSELAVAIMLLVGAGLLLKSFTQVQKVPPGFKPAHLLTFRLFLPEHEYEQSSRVASFGSELVEKLMVLPGATSVGLGSVVPFGSGFDTASFDIEGFTGDPSLPHGMPIAVDAGYFETLRIPLIQGRFFTGHDDASGAPVAIVDEKLARYFWPHESPLGKRIHINSDRKNGQPVWREIVGVVGHVKMYGLAAEAKGQYYFPHPQIPVRNISFIIRTTTDPKSLTSAVQNQVWSLNKNLPLSGVKTMTDLLDRSLMPKRQLMYLVALFAVLALLLAAVGLYGVISLSVDQRTRELGIRMALGAQPSSILRLVIGRAMQLVLLGTAIGVAGALVLTRALSASLFGISSADPLTFAGASALLALVALTASYIPARRATKTDPMVALRYE